jgi:hypothetical protein
MLMPTWSRPTAEAYAENRASAVSAAEPMAKPLPMAAVVLPMASSDGRDADAVKPGEVEGDADGRADQDDRNDGRLHAHGETGDDVRGGTRLA